MTRVIEVPGSFDERTFDQFAASFSEPSEERFLFDAHAVKWASPYGLLGLLVAGQAVVEAKRPQPQLAIPTDRDVLHYWSRTGFFEYANEWFEIHGKVPQVTARRSSDVLLEITPVRGSDDVHGVVSVIQERAAAILSGELGLETKATLGFGMALSEACQNIVEHAGTSGWVAVQTYEWRRRLGRRVVVIAVADAGIGFRRSLDATRLFAPVCVDTRFEVRLASAEWQQATLRRIEVNRCRLTGFSAPESHLQSVRFDHCSGKLAHFRFTAFKHVLFVDCDLEEADFRART